MADKDFDNMSNNTNWQLGRNSVRKGKFDDADRRFKAEITQADSPNTLVYDDHGHLLNMMGRYDDAIDKFNNLLNINPNFVSSLFGKGISYIGLNSLDESLLCFSEVTEIDVEHADAWYYSAIIYGNPFYHGYDPTLAKESYVKYQNSRDIYIKNSNYFNEPFDDLSLEELHKSNNPSKLFCLIDRLLEKGNIDEFNDFLNDYCKLYCFDEGDLAEQFDIFRLFDDDSSLVGRIEEFNVIKDIENKFESAGFDEILIDSLSSRFGEPSIKNKAILVEIMDYFKCSQLSFSDINDLIQEFILDDEMLIVEFNDNKEYIVQSRIKDNNLKIAREELGSELNKTIEENKYLTEELAKTNEFLNVLHKQNDDLRQNIQNLEDADKKISNQPNRSFDSYDEVMGEILLLMDEYYSDNRLYKKMESSLKDCYKDICPMKIVGIFNEDYHVDLEILKDKYGISEEGLKAFESAFENFKKEEFEEASYIFDSKIRKEFNAIDELKNYRIFLKVTSLSRNGKFKEAYEQMVHFLKIEDYRKKKEKRQKENKKNGEKICKKEKYPVGWFNFANICFDYANLVSAEDFIELKKEEKKGTEKEEIEKARKQAEKARKQAEKARKQAYELAYFCYDCAKSSLSDLEENSDYEFNFESKNTKEVFKNNLSMMINSRKIYDNLEEFKKLQLKINGDLSKLKELQLKINGDLDELKNSEQKEDI